MNAMPEATMVPPPPHPQNRIPALLVLVVALLSVSMHLQPALP